MDKIALKISQKDWLYIIMIGAFFGFLIALVFYFLTPSMRDFSTIYFSVGTAITIAVFASLFITLSNYYILPEVNPSFWHIISFFFSFNSGLLGFSLSFWIAFEFNLPITKLIAPWWLGLSVTLGFLTFLIGLILHQFISMKYKHEQSKSQILESRLKALENELNPHFLFNALNSMSELVYLDPQKAEKAILNLSYFLRNAINKESLIDLELEIKMIETYINIENIRFDNNIILHISLDEKMREYKVPKFSIQLLVENAIKHGFLQKSLNIDIIAQKDTITVSNDGKITEDIYYGTGLKNLKDRLRLLDVGVLKHRIYSDKMEFSIVLDSKRKGRL